jgi:hypothetical protein
LSCGLKNVIYTPTKKSVPLRREFSKHEQPKTQPFNTLRICWKAFEDILEYNFVLFENKLPENLGKILPDLEFDEEIAVAEQFKQARSR